MVVDGCVDAEPRTEATSTATTTHPTHGTTYGLSTWKTVEIQHKNKISMKIINFMLFPFYLLFE